MAPQFVRPYVKTNKNDARDAEEICEAMTRPTMRFVPIKTAAQPAILALHRARQGSASRSATAGKSQLSMNMTPIFLAEHAQKGAKYGHRTEASSSSLCR
jgi:transposase